MELIYCCGFNGFGQVDLLQDCLSDTFQQSKTDNDPNCTNSRQHQSPVLVCPLPFFHTVHNVLFTWDKIAVTFQNSDNGTFTSFISQEDESKNIQVQGNEKCISKMYPAVLAIASTDTDIVIGDAADQGHRYILRSDLKDSIPFSVESQSAQPPPSIQLICGGHTDFFCIYDKLQFGKISTLEGTLKPKEETCEEQNLLMSIPLYHIDSCVQVSALSCGKEHVLLLSSNGCIYTYGLGSRGQLGHCTVEPETTPRLLEALEGIIIASISAGGWHSAAVSTTGDLYTWGWNESGQLGLASLISCQQNGRTRSTSVSEDELVGIQAEPKCTNISIDITVTAVACGSRHTICLTVQGKVMSCGWNEYGQLGQGNSQSYDKFTEIPGLSNVVRIFAGQWNSVFVSSKKKV